jgi:hypothetical protein
VHVVVLERERGELVLVRLALVMELLGELVELPLHEVELGDEALFDISLCDRDIGGDLDYGVLEALLDRVHAGLHSRVLLLHMTDRLLHAV